MRRDIHQSVSSLHFYKIATLTHSNSVSLTLTPIDEGTLPFLTVFIKEAAKFGAP